MREVERRVQEALRAKSIGVWMNGLGARAPRNGLIVAMANKAARITWAALSSGEQYRAATLAA